MNPVKPTLTTLLIRRHFWAALLTLILLLSVLLALTDIVLLHNRRHALAQQLDVIESTENAALLLCDIGNRPGKEHAGMLILDAEGHWSSEPTDKPSLYGPTPPMKYAHWDQALTVLSTGAVHGTGHLPWLSEPVIWAARRMDNPDGDPEIVVAWERVGSIRAATVSIYVAVGIAILFAFGISIAVALNTVKGVRVVLDGIADSSGRMAAGDFSGRLPPQPTVELDRVTQSINALAHALHRTTSDLHDDHQRLQRLEETQRQFVADASHELRAPLTSMRVTLEAWQDGILRPDEQPQALMRLLQETERLGSLVMSLLDLSRIDSGRETIVLAPLDLVQVIHEVCAGMRDPRRAAIDIDIPADFPPVLANKDAVYRVLYNLIENAQRFTAPAGTIRIRTTPDDTGTRISVSDTGCGIDAEFLPRIWDRFARAPEARVNEKTGSGLGLAIVKSLVEAMGGQVAAESIPGCGTTVSFRLRFAGEQRKSS